MRAAIRRATTSRPRRSRRVERRWRPRAPVEGNDDDVARVVALDRERHLAAADTAGRERRGRRAVSARIDAAVGADHDRAAVARGDDELVVVDPGVAAADAGVGSHDHRRAGRVGGGDDEVGPAVVRRRSRPGGCRRATTAASATEPERATIAGVITGANATER